MDDQRGPVAPYTRGLFHAEEVLQSGGDPGWTVLFVVNLCVASGLQMHGQGREFGEEACASLCFEQRNELAGCVSEAGKALPPETPFADRFFKGWRLDPGELQASKEVGQFILADQVFDALIERGAGKNIGGLFG